MQCCSKSQDGVDFGSKHRPDTLSPIRGNSQVGGELEIQGTTADDLVVYRRSFGSMADRIVSTPATPPRSVEAVDTLTDSCWSCSYFGRHGGQLKGFLKLTASHVIAVFPHAQGIETQPPCDFAMIQRVCLGRHGHFTLCLNTGWQERYSSVWAVQIVQDISVRLAAACVPGSPRPSRDRSTSHQLSPAAGLLTPRASPQWPSHERPLAQSVEVSAVHSSRRRKQSKRLPRKRTKEQETFLKASELLKATGQTEEERVRAAVAEVLRDMANTEARYVSRFVTAFKQRAMNMLSTIRGGASLPVVDASAECTALSNFKAGFSDFFLKRHSAMLSTLLIEIPAEDDAETYGTDTTPSMPTIVNESLEGFIFHPVQDLLLEALRLQGWQRSAELKSKVLELRSLPVETYGLEGILVDVSWHEAITILEHFACRLLLPYERLEALLLCVSEVESLYARELTQETPTGEAAAQVLAAAPLCADNLLAVFTHLIVSTEPEVCLHVVVEYLRAISGNNLGPQGYYLCVLASAIEYIISLNLSASVPRTPKQYLNL